jgi:hypothetical protein
LFEGQQFCRACGAPTRKFSSEELPTQLLPHQQQQQQQQPTQHPPQTPLGTAPLSGGRNTSDPVYGVGYQSYQPPVVVSPAQQQQQGAQPRHTSPVGVAPPPRRRSRGWLYAVLALIIFFGGASLVAGLFFANRSQRTIRVTRPRVVVPPVPNVPNVPDMPPMPQPHVGDGDELLENEGAEVSGNQTTITKTYPLASGGSFAVHNINGDIVVEGWDEQQAEVQIIKRGGSPQARDALKIMREQSQNRLAFNTMPEMQAGGVEEVRYVVKVPRNLRELELVSNNSNIVLVGAQAASVSVVVQRGNIKLEDVSGTINSRTTKGNTVVVLSEAARNAPQVFNGISGNIELELAPDINAELKAETVSGNIEIDEDFGIKVEKRMIGQQAIGRIGKGGQPIVVKTVSGNIKIRS